MTVPRASELTLREKVGQCFVVGFDGTEPPARLTRLVDEWGPGGVVYFARNLSTPAATSALSAALQRTAEAAGSPPLFVTVDQEGGLVSRLRWGTQLPGAMALGAVDDADLTAEAGAATGAKLRSLGINADFAPVLDVNVEPDNPVIGVRAFGDDPARVARHGAAFASGLRSAGVLACGKHFPGHGDTRLDSHHDLPTVDADRERLDAVELAPFEAAVEAGIDAVMTTHVAFPAMTGDRSTPATVSRSVVDGLLRAELGFDGLVVTDCLEMDAVAEGVGTASAALGAIEAGCDLVLVSHTPEKQRAAMERVYRAVRSGRLDEARLDESVERILAAKRSRGVADRPAIGWEDAAERARAVGRAVARRAVTRVRDRSDALPLSGPVAVLTRSDRSAAVPGEAQFDPGVLTGAIAAKGLDVRHIGISDAVGADAPAPDETAVVVTGNVAADSPAAARIQDLQRNRRPGRLVVVSLRGPYVVRALPEVDCFVTAYDDAPVTLQAVGAVLAGELEPRGTLPVRLS